MELREAHRVEREVFGQELQRDALIELEIVGPVNLSHSAAAEQRDDAVAAGKEGSGIEAPCRAEPCSGRGRVAETRQRLVHSYGLWACTYSRTNFFIGASGDGARPSTVRMSQPSI